MGATARRRAKESNCDTEKKAVNSQGGWSLLSPSDRVWLPFALIFVVAVHLASPVRGQVEEALSQWVAKWSIWDTAPSSWQVTLRSEGMQVDVYRENEHDGVFVGTLQPKQPPLHETVKIGDRFFFTIHGTFEPIVDESGKRIEHDIVHGTDEVVVPHTARRQGGKCIDRHRFCPKEAQNGRCYEIPGYMIPNCCASCDPIMNSSALLDPQVRCTRKFLDTASTLAWRRGDPHRMFTSITTSRRWTKLRPRVLSSPPGKPWVVQLDRFLSRAECDTLVELAEHIGFKNSGITAEKTSAGESASNRVDTRTSRTAWCSEGHCRSHTIVRRLRERVRNLTQIDASNQEHLQFLIYGKGEFYGAHMDTESASAKDAAGHRVLTMLLYLSDVDGGGDTAFPDLDLKVTPRRGAALLWSNVLDQDPGKVDERMRHQAMPVDIGVKRAANLWIHQYNFEKAFEWGCQ